MLFTLTHRLGGAVGAGADAGGDLGSTRSRTGLLQRQEPAVPAPAPATAWQVTLTTDSKTLQDWERISHFCVPVLRAVSSCKALVRGVLIFCFFISLDSAPGKHIKQSFKAAPTMEGSALLSPSVSPHTPDDAMCRMPYPNKPSYF